MVPAEFLFVFILGKRLWDYANILVLLNLWPTYCYLVAVDLACCDCFCGALMVVFFALVMTCFILFFSFSCISLYRTSQILHLFIFLCFFFHYHLVPLYPIAPSNHPVVHAHESFYLFVPSLYSLTSPPPQLSPCSPSMRLPVLLVSSVYSLDST